MRTNRGNEVSQEKFAYKGRSCLLACTPRCLGAGVGGARGDGGVKSNGGCRKFLLTLTNEGREEGGQRKSGKTGNE